MNEEDKEKKNEFDALLNSGEVVSNEITVIPEPEIDDDYEFARQHIKDTITKGNVALTELLDLAVTSGHPRAFEVLAMYIKNISEASRQLLETKHTNHRISIIDGKSNKPEVINNNLFVGTTADLSRMMNEIKKQQE